jgi:hypothetical protein
MSMRRGVAQFGSALALGARCRRFESCLPDCHLSGSPNRSHQPGADGIGFFVSKVRSSRVVGAGPINPSDVARTQHGFDNSEPTQITVNGQVIRLSVPSDRAVVERVAALIDRRVAENDWRPHTSREAALQCWAKLGGIRVAVLKAKGLL